MLKHIYIKNFTIISQLDLELAAGLTVLTGETGAGKSILLDAIQIALGERAEANLIRTGCERCEITISFDVTQILAAKQWLLDNELDEGNECIISRILSKDGRSRSTINGRPCPLQQIRDLGSLLVQIHGQHQHQALLKSDHQRELLDNFANHPELLRQVRDLYKQWKTIQAELEQLTSSTQDHSARIELLQYQLQELNQLALRENELAELEQEQKQLASAESVINGCNQVLNILSEEDRAASINTLHAANQQLISLATKNPSFNNAVELISNAIVQVEEAITEVNDYLNRIEVNPERLQTVEQRLTEIHDMARKHHVQPEQLIELQQKIAQQLHNLLHSGERIQQLNQQLAKLNSEHHQKAEKLSQSRQQAAQKLSKLITQQIQKLGMPNGKFQVQLNLLNLSQPSAYGLERVEFLVNTNPGQALQSMNKIASGGELSRIALAILVITAQKTAMPTLIFDEVDVGISGATAEIVGQLLKTLGETAQSFCITHLAQVAAQGNQHLHIQKITHKDSTETIIRMLSKEERIDELARILGGIKITERTIAHAKEMLGLEGKF